MDVIACAIATVACVLVACLALGLVPEINPSQATRMTKAVDADNGAICTRLNFDPATPSYAACLRELDSLRRRDRQLDAIPF